MSTTSSQKKKKKMDLSEPEKVKILREIERQEQRRSSRRKHGEGALKIVIVEKKDKEVSHCWKNCSILTYVLVIVCGIATAKAMGDIIFLFSNRCILNATLLTYKDENGTRWIYAEPYSNKYQDVVRYGDQSSCDFAQFFPVASVAVAGSLATFFAMCGRGRGDMTRNLPEPWRIVPVSFLFNFIFVVSSCVHVAYIYDGLSLFCKNIHPIDDSKLSSCSELYGAKVVNGKGEFDLKTNIVTAQVFSVLSLISWLLGFLVVLIRCLVHADFHVLTQIEYGHDGNKGNMMGNSGKGKSNGGNHNNKKKANTEQEPLISSDSIDYEYSTPLTSINF